MTIQSPTLKTLTAQTGLQVGLVSIWHFIAINSSREVIAQSPHVVTGQDSAVWACLEKTPFFANPS